jgi:3-deoxy-D-manno-octulosonic-acid transferase
VEIVDDAPALAARVDALLRDPARRRALGTHARAVVQANRGALERCLVLVDTLLPPQRRDQ